MDNNNYMRIFIVQVFCAWLLLALSPVVKDDNSGNNITYIYCRNGTVLVEARLNSLCHIRRSAVPTHTAILAQSEAEDAEKR